MKLFHWFLLVILCSIVLFQWMQVIILENDMENSEETIIQNCNYAVNN